MKYKPSNVEAINRELIDKTNALLLLNQALLYLVHARKAVDQLQFYGFRIPKTAREHMVMAWTALDESYYEIRSELGLIVKYPKT